MKKSEHFPGDAEYPDREAAAVPNRDAVQERVALAENDRHAGLPRGRLRVGRICGGIAVHDRLVAIDPDEGADREPCNGDHEGDQDQVPWPAGTQERDQSVAPLEACGRAQVAGVRLGSSQLRAKVGVGRKLVQVTAELREQVAARAPPEIAQPPADVTHVLVPRHGFTSSRNAALMRDQVSVPACSCSAPLEVTE